MKTYYVYILASFRRALYVGISGNLETRMAYHRSLENRTSFTGRYGITRLVHVKEYSDPNQAIAREKQLKAWRREKKIKLVERGNPHSLDLAAPTHTDPSSSLRSGSG